MEKIALPKKIDIKKGENSNNATIIIESCYPGYGTTLGNSLRRVLLSSLSGVAVVGVKIKGTDHEFKALPYIKEDVLEIILNLKQLRLKKFSDDEVKLSLEVHGKKEVKASDIIKNANVEIVNSDLVLANITDMAGSLSMEIFVNNGVGYCSVEAIEDKKNEIDYIEMDAIFSPVLSVGINVDNIRVGKMTNWDKLELNILTDGTITPKEAFEQSVNILIKQFSSLVGKKEKVGEEKDKKKVKKEKENKLEKNKSK